MEISIHAPRTGSDSGSVPLSDPHGDFNPRSPYGERPLRPGDAIDSKDFNPRSPYGERRV